MSLYDYRESLEIAKKDYGFCALIMAAMRKADSDNLSKLLNEWPDIWNELYDRYHVPGGPLPGEKKTS